MKQPTAADARKALVAAAQRLLARGTVPFCSADIEQAAGVPAGSLEHHFAGREAFAEAVAAAVQRSLKARWQAGAAPSADTVRANAPARRPSRLALIEAGKRLLSSDRLDAHSIDGIVQEAGVAKGSFFNHFATRDDLVRAVLSTVQDEMAEVIGNAVAHLADPVERLAHGFVAALRYGLANRLGARAMTRVTPDDTNTTSRLNADLRQLLLTGMARGDLTRADSEAVVVMAIGLTEMGSLRLLTMQDDAGRVDALLYDLCLTLLQMLGVSAGRQARLADAAVHSPQPSSAARGRRSATAALP